MNFVNLPILFLLDVNLFTAMIRLPVRLVPTSQLWCITSRQEDCHRVQRTMVRDYARRIVRYHGRRRRY